jgi:integrase
MSSYITLSKGTNIVLRARKIKSGYSLLLDIHHDGRRVHEYLKMIVSSVNRKEMTNHDKDLLKQAELIKSKRILEINSEGYQIQTRKGTVLLTDFLQEFYEMKAKEQSRSLQKYDALIKHCRIYFPASTTLQSIKGMDMEGFRDYLLTKIKPNTAAPYFSMLGGILRKAYQDDLISINPMDKVRRKIKRNETERTFLILEEIEKLEGASCHERVKNAFLFCCFTGLRFSDVSKLNWEQIKKEGEQHFLYFTQLKTNKIERMPIAKQALKYLPKRKLRNDRVFDLPSLRTTLDHLKSWSEKAKLDKHVTFHTARHSFATLALTYGIDIKTVSSLLGHREVKTTEIYAKIIDKKKEAAVAMLPEIGE